MLSFNAINMQDFTNVIYKIIISAKLVSKKN